MRLTTQRAANFSSLTTGNRTQSPLTRLRHNRDNCQACPVYWPTLFSACYLPIICLHTLNSFHFCFCLFYFVFAFKSVIELFQSCAKLNFLIGSFVHIYTLYFSFSKIFEYAIFFMQSKVIIFIWIGLDVHLTKYRL